MHIHRNGRWPASRIARSLLVVILLASPAVVMAQKPAGAGTASSSLPDTPQPKQQTAQNQGVPEKFVGYITNKSIVFPDIATSGGPMTTGEKFKLFVNQSISPAYLIATGISAANSQARNVPSAYGQGWEAYGSRYGATLARASSNAFFTSFVLPTVLHQDPRFFPQTHPTLWGSVKYSAKRLVVTRNDDGRSAFNYSGILGTMMSESLANAYLPVSEQTAGKTFERVGTDMGWKFASNMFKNYWPTVFHTLGLRRLVVIPDPGLPDSPAATTPKF